MPIKRPIAVSTIGAIVGIATICYGFRLYEAIFFWKILREYGAYPTYVAFSGGFWTLVSLSMVIGIWKGRAWAWAGTIYYGIAIVVWYWLDRLVIQVPHSNWPFAVVFTILLSSISAIALFNHKTVVYFKHSGNNS